MKLTKAIALLSVAAAGILPSAPAQQADQGPVLVAAAQMKNAKGSRLSTLQLLQPTTVAKGMVMLKNPQPEQPPLEMNVNSFKFLLIMTPADLANATRTYATGANLSDARRQLAAVRNKYGAFVGVPGNPALKAARMELDCCVRLMDWAAVGKLVESTPGKQFLEAQDRVDLEAAQLMSQVSDDPQTAATRQKELEAFLSSSKGKAVSSDVYAWLKYALGRALASNIPAEELKKGISANNVKVASLAVDAYCEAYASDHGRHAELPVDALKRAFAILWAMPGVKSEALSVKQMDAKKWGSSSSNFRDAVVIAYMLDKIVAPGQSDDNIQRAAKLFYNQQEGKK